MRVMVLGCGPAGLMAAHGVMHATDGEAEVLIFSQKRKSELHGAQYLHEPIPGATWKSSRTVTYSMQGDVNDYRVKVYGPLWDGKVSPEDLVGNHEAWDIRHTYDRLWDHYEPLIRDSRIIPADLGIVMASEGKPDLIINSIPRNTLCIGQHTFGSTRIVAAGEAPSRGIRIPYACGDEEIICNGNEHPSWYRLSRVFGHTTVEWPEGTRPPVTTATQVIKPTFNNCDCWPEVKHVGRYGRWEKGVLSHTAYADAMKYVQELIAR